MLRKMILVLGLVTVIVGGAFATGEVEVPSEPTIVDIAVEDGRFTTLVAALEAADLVDTLSGEGPFTVFAPTDDAFDALPDGTVEALLNDIPTLTNILTYHVVAGSVPASQVVDLVSAETINGLPVAIYTDGGVRVNESNVVITDIEGSNGIIHVVDQVILPPSEDLVDTAANAGSFETLVAAVEAAGLVDTLRSEGPFTVFAPTDEAFGKLPAGTVESLLNDIPTLTSILTYHVVPGRVFAGDVVGLDAAPTVQGEDISVSVSGGSVMLNDSATVVATDILTTNGLVHVIDEVILPPSLR